MSFPTKSKTRSRSSSTRSNSNQRVAKKRNPKKKKQCELGTECPYKGEYQHSLEYAHDESSLNKETPVAFSGTGQSMAGGAKSSHTTSRHRPQTSSGDNVRHAAAEAAMRRAAEICRNDGHGTTKPSSQKSTPAAATGNDVIILDDGEDENRVVLKNVSSKKPIVRNPYHNKRSATVRQPLSTSTLRSPPDVVDLCDSDDDQVH
eukprot:scaffold8053_cov60-Attheya_sp.AAC.1